jgi:hypothetical protein
MAITQAFTNSFKFEVLQGDQDLTADTLKMALYTSSASLDASTTVYSGTNEVSGTGYTGGGNTITGITIDTSSSGVVFLSFDTVSWPGSTFTARGALIYNTSKSNTSVAVLDFGMDQTCSTQTFAVTLPPNNFNSAIFRFS